jgi:hypothetical protein
MPASPRVTASQALILPLPLSPTYVILAPLVCSATHVTRKVTKG